MEFALIAPILVVAAFATFDLGNAAQQQIELQEAVRAGAVYASSFPTDPTGIAAAVKNAVPASWTDVTVTVSDLVACSGISTSLCVTVSASRPNAPLTTGISVVDGIVTVSASYVARFN